MSDYQGNIIIKNPATPTGPSTFGSAPGMWKLSDVAYWIKQGVWPNTSIIPDQYFPYVSLLLSTTSLGNANNNLFVDSSGVLNPVSRGGNTTQGSFTPYATNWSNYFDGSGDNLKTPSNAAFAYGTGDFTWEMWVFPTAANWTTDNYYLLDHGSNGGTISYFQNVVRYYNPTTGIGSVLYTGGGSIPANQWSHVAVSRSGGTTRLFVNGALRASASDSNNYGGAVVTVADYGSGGIAFPGYISNVRIVKGTAVYTSAFTPPTSPLTAITNTSLLTCQSNRFRDASTNNFTVTSNGDTRVTDYGPFSPSTYAPIAYNQSDITNWSGYFDGNGDFLAIADNAAFDFGTGDFTIECWVYLNAYNPTFGSEIFSAHTFGVSADYIFNINTTGKLFFQIGSSSSLFTSTNSVPLNQWTHIAVVRSGNTFTPYINGVNAGGAATSSSAVNATRTLTIGSDLTGNAGASLNGYISNHRVVKGTAVYTSNFTPSTTPLTAISGTSLLTLQNAAFTDNSTNNFVITPNGNVTVTGNSPFNTVGYWSNYFNGTTGNWFSVPDSASLQMGSSDFTYECWLYPTAIPNTYQSFIEKRGVGGYAGVLLAIKSSGKYSILVASSSSTWGIVDESTINVNLNAWQHIAVVRSGSTFSVYLNGVRQINTTISFSVYDNTSVQGIGAGDSSGNQPFYGYISNVRIVKGTAVYSGASFTPPTTPLTAISGTSLLTCQNGRFIDNSTNAFTITVTGSPSVQSFDPFYTSTIASNGGSMYFDGSGDYLSLPDNPSLQLGPSSFTVEYWWYPVSIAGYQTPFEKGYTSSGGLLMQTGNGDGIIYVYASGSAVITASTAVGAGRWNHVALVRNGTSLVLYLNGVSIGSATNSTDFNNTGVMGIGANVSGGGAGTYPINGYMSDVRVTKGTALYTAAFTPPTAPLTPSSNTGLLVNGMNAGIYDATTINDMETIGNAQVSTVQSKFGGSSAYFDGSGDGLKFPSNVAMAMGTGNFTWELWVRATAASGYQSLIDTRTAVLTDGFFFGLDTGTLRPAVFTNGTVLVSSTSLTANTWQHLALVRSSGTLTIYLDGTSIGSVANSTNLTSGVGTIGSSDSISNPNWFNGYIDDLRVTRGVARYTSNFTPPTQAFPVY